MITAALARDFPNFFPQKYLYFTGSGTSALFLYLKAQSIAGKKIICPSNICFSVVFAIVQSGNTPLFCDIDPSSGNISLDDLMSLTSCHHDIGAAILPYMFGNAIEDLPLIIKHCREKGILTVEDMAAALGSEYKQYTPGTLGDTAIYSFGRNKHVDMGIGGLLGLNSDTNLSLESLSFFGKETAAAQHRFEKAYKAVLYLDDYLQRLESLQQLAHHSSPSYIGQFTPDADYERLLFSRLQEVLQTKKKRVATVAYIDRNILFLPAVVQPYTFTEGSNIWRYNLLVLDQSFKDNLIGKLLEARMPVSIWYPPINTLFGQDFTPKSLEFSRKILNLDIAKMNQTEIDKFIALVNSQIEVVH